MPAGLQVYGTSGVLQIDGDTVCTNLASINNVVTNNNGICGYNLITGIPANSMYFHNSPIPMRIGKWDSNRNGLELYSQSAVNTNIYSFNGIPPSGSNGAGLEVFNASGVKVFSTDWRTLKIVGVFQVTGNNPGYTGSQSWQIPSNCVAAMSTPTEFMIKLPRSMADIYTGGISINGNTLTYSWFRINNFNTLDDRNREIPYYYGYDSGLAVQIVVASLDYL